MRWIKLRDGRGPWHGATWARRGRRECSCVHESRASWPGDADLVGRCASRCSSSWVAEWFPGRVSDHPLVSSNRGATVGRGRSDRARLRRRAWNRQPLFSARVFHRARAW